MPTVIVSGASRGIGKAIAQKLASQKYNIVLLARNEQDLLKLQDQLVQYYQVKVLTFAIDISQEQAVENAIKQSLHHFSDIEVLINNAGIGIFKPLEQTSLAYFQTIFSVNVQGTFLLSKALIPHFKAQRKGHIISVISDAARRTFAYGTVYCASKYAQDALLMALRQEVREYNIKISNLYPGLTDTSFANSQQGADYKKDYLQVQDLAESVWYILNAPAHVVVDEIMLHPKKQN